MQTFLPYADFERSAKVLDRLRLGKQRTDCLKILKALTGECKGWTSHPVTKMWRGYEGLLARYGVAICKERISRGYRKGFLDQLQNYADRYSYQEALPWWFGDHDLHASYRAVLLFKDPEHYGQVGWDEEPSDLVMYPRELFQSTNG